MGAWLCNFSEFERNQDKLNQWVLNFRYFSNDGSLNKSVKVKVPRVVSVPSGFIHNRDASSFEQKIKNHEFFSGFPLERKTHGRFSVFNIQLPMYYELMRILNDEFDGKFQTGNYDRFLKYSGEFPERIADISQDLEAKFMKEDEIELESLEGINFRQYPDCFPSAEALSLAPYVIIDIEKPLWKKLHEKKQIDARKKIKKLERRWEILDEKKRKYDSGRSKKQLTSNELKMYEKLSKRTSQRRNAISFLEKKLEFSAEKVGMVKLFEEKYDSDISFVAVNWVDPRTNTEIKELFVLDPNEEFQEFRDYNGYRILRFKQEEEIIEALTERFHERKPLISYGHNQVYDITQLTFASNESKKLFDPAVKGVKPRRDFVRFFLQRLRQDLIYFDTLWLNRDLFRFWRGKKSLGDNHKLEGEAKSYEVAFKKSMTHDELRVFELERLVGRDLETRKAAMQDMLKYAASDLEVTHEIVKRMNFLPFLAAMKKAAPFATLTDLAFSNNVMNNLHEYSHFQDSENLQYYGYSQKERQDEIQIFKKRFTKLKRDMVRWAFDKEGIEKASKGVYNGVHEFYLPLEEMLKDFLFKVHPQLKEVYAEFKDDEYAQFALMQELKGGLRDVLVDYYFARRERKSYDHTKEQTNTDGEKLGEYFSILGERIDRDELNKLKGSFRYLKNHFRSLYVALDGKKDRRLIMPPKNLENLDIFYPKAMENDVDLFLLREHAGEIKEGLTKAKKKDLAAFLSNFDTFMGLIENIGEKIGEYVFVNPYDLLFSYVYHDRMELANRKFYARYGFEVKQVSKAIGEAYSKFARELGELEDCNFLEFKGDYFYVQSESRADIPSARYTRTIPNYYLGVKPEEASKPESVAK
ncbi:MAG: hypothetical protein ABIH72_02955 [archaeon]